jgi:hypothetical protein
MINSYPRTIRTTIVLPAAVRRLAEQAARDDHRTLSAYIALLIESHVGAPVLDLRRVPAPEAR